ncbi:putative hydantoin utilization protein A [Rosellinia necatrix]|uniref:Putative hydantoin utilization protein A n=1 Tax=Rosellinia necatrix TaxID=77044 RepID=A0A1W2TDQ1_ROSNE|nr:putative hydantoin utilization protein A [Rosellinia necatrix]
MGSTVAGKTLRIGVDVGGTNTDGVILDPSRASDPDRGILAWHKAPTTPDPSVGISSAITAMFAGGAADPSRVASVTIGTTHFVNAVVERDAARLSKVAVLRLCGPFSKHAPPCVDWPGDLRALVLGHHALLGGGLEVDGRLIADLDEAQIRRECAVVRAKGIRSVVVNGVFSPVDATERQEERAAALVRAEIPGCDVVCSSEVANLGFLERENAAILNASILAFARRTIRSFREPVRRLGLSCPVFVAQNDGTILSGEMAARLPIRTFSSGPTNSMRGAAFLVQSEADKAVMVVDIGGTTTDVGLLLANGFPRQQAAYSDLAGVRMNFSCPDIKSIGLGGGSIVRDGERFTVGPDSVGYEITKKSVAFGGSTLTATDYAMLLNTNLEIGDRELVRAALSDKSLAKFKATVKTKLEKIIDTMKTSPEDIPVLLVGGGAIIAPDELKGASKVLKPRWSGVANAIGAAMARVSTVIDTVESTESTTTKQLLEKIRNSAIEKIVTAGALRSTVEIVETDILPLPYIANKSRFIVRAAGDFDFSRADSSDILADQPDHDVDVHADSVEKTEGTFSKNVAACAKTTEDVDINNYNPKVRDRVWYISETDLAWIASGCYILGTGGGGSPYSSMVRIREMLRRGAVIRVVSPADLPDDAAVGCGGGAGSPTVGIEKLAGDEMVQAQEELFKVCGRRATHMIAVEIGGHNGLQSMLLGASPNLDIPAVDGDWMGRAYPTKWQTTPVVFGERSPVFAPVAMADGNGNVVVMPAAASDFHVERICRAALSEMGSSVATADAPVSGRECKRWVVENTISQSWRIGRAVARARLSNQVDNVAETIIAECGGAGAGQVLWKGKIVGVERTLKMGHVYGECIIEGVEVTDDDSRRGAIYHANDNDTGVLPASRFSGLLKVPFKNENIAAIKISRTTTLDGEMHEQEEEVLCIVPDLVTIIDAQNGEAIGTPEYRYGLLVVVLGIAASDHWTSERGIEIGGPKGFDIDRWSYKSLGKFVKPISVIDEYDVSEQPGSCHG